MLNGKKCYILAALMVVGAIASLLAGVIDTKELVESLAAAAALVSIKSAVVKVEK